MCGIVGYIGHQDATPILLEGLRRLEYRGYDSAGLATISAAGLRVVRTVRNGQASAIDDLARRTRQEAISGNIGIGHTRWGTHGPNTSTNAHPHRDAHNRIAIVHNGTLYNHRPMADFLGQQGIALEGQTDTEVLAKLMGYYYAQTQDFVGSIQRALMEAEGTFGIAAICIDTPGVLVAAVNGATLLAGFSNHAAVIASNEQAIIGQATHMVSLQDGQMAIIGADTFSLMTIVNSVPLSAMREAITSSFSDTTPGTYRHFLEKEIHEQPQALEELLRGRIRQTPDDIVLGGLAEVEGRLLTCERALLFGCGTAWHAGLIGRYLLEGYAHMPAQVEIASELAIRNPMIQRDTVAIAISQSGDTKDTLDALAEVKRRGALTLGVVNVVESRIPKVTDAGVYLRVGIEKSVASTKAFTGQVMALALVAGYLGRRRRLAPDQLSALLTELRRLPEKMQAILDNGLAIKQAAEVITQHESCLYLGRGINFPVALEGALKLKELSYIHAEGLPTPEMKHGHIALLTQGTPVIAIIPPDAQYASGLVSLSEAKLRGATVIAVTQYSATPEIDEVADIVLRVPDTAPLLSPLLTCLPLQLLAYQVALLRGLDIDHPRNLAKSVTV